MLHYNRKDYVSKQCYYLGPLFSCDCPALRQNCTTFVRLDEQRSGTIMCVHTLRVSIENCMRKKDILWSCVI